MSHLHVLRKLIGKMLHTMFALVYLCVCVCVIWVFGFSARDHLLTSLFVPKTKEFSIVCTKEKAKYGHMATKRKPSYKYATLVKQIKKQKPGNAVRLEWNGNKRSRWTKQSYSYSYKLHTHRSKISECNECGQIYIFRGAHNWRTFWEKRMK